MQATVNGWIEPDTCDISGERRARQRYALRMPLEYRLLGGEAPVAGCGTTCNLSSEGIAFELDTDIELGSYVELAIEWPIAVRGKSNMRLIVRGTLLRAEDGIGVLKIRRCAFRNQPNAAAAGMHLVG